MDDFVVRYVRASLRLRPSLSASDLLRLVLSEFGVLYTYNGMQSLMSG